MKHLCQTGIDYEECEEVVDTKGDTCSNCCEKAQESFLEDFYGGSTSITLKEKQEVVAK